MSTTITGTYHFVSKSDALSYYRNEGGYVEETASELLDMVTAKIAKREISIGQPPPKPNHSTIKIDGGKRYAYEEN